MPTRVVVGIAVALFGCAVFVGSASAAADVGDGRVAGPPTLFDDFSYSARRVAPHGWVVRTKPGWPGVPGAAGGART